MSSTSPTFARIGDDWGVRLPRQHAEEAIDGGEPVRVYKRDGSAKAVYLLEIVKVVGDDVICTVAGPARMPRETREPRAKAEPRTRYPSSPPVEGATECSSRRKGRGDSRWAAGDVIPVDGVYHMVLASHLVAPNEDMGHYDWRECAWVRRATNDEATPRRLRDEARAELDAIRKAVDEASRSGVRVSDSISGDVLVLKARSADKLIDDSERLCVLDDTTVRLERHGDPDMCDSYYAYRLQVQVPAEVVARIRTLIANARS